MVSPCVVLILALLVTGNTCRNYAKVTNKQATVKSKILMVKLFADMYVLRLRVISLGIAYFLSKAMT